MQVLVSYLYSDQNCSHVPNFPMSLRFWSKLWFCLPGPRLLYHKQYWDCNLWSPSGTGQGVKAAGSTCRTARLRTQMGSQ